LPNQEAVVRFKDSSLEIKHDEDTVERKDNDKIISRPIGRNTIEQLMSACYNSPSKTGTLKESQAEQVAIWPPGSGMTTGHMKVGQQKEAFTNCVVSQIPGWCMSSSYHTAYPNWDCPADVCHLFLISFICAPTTAFT
jgi:hypothetical protein